MCTLLVNTRPDARMPPRAATLETPPSHTQPTLSVCARCMRMRRDAQAGCDGSSGKAGALHLACALVAVLAEAASGPLRALAVAGEGGAAQGAVSGGSSEAEVVVSHVEEMLQRQAGGVCAHRGVGGGGRDGGKHGCDGDMCGNAGKTKGVGVEEVMVDEQVVEEVEEEENDVEECGFLAHPCPTHAHTHAHTHTHPLTHAPTHPLTHARTNVLMVVGEKARQKRCSTAGSQRCVWRQAVRGGCGGRQSGVCVEVFLRCSCVGCRLMSGAERC